MSAGTIKLGGSKGGVVNSLKTRPSNRWSRILTENKLFLSGCFAQASRMIKSLANILNKAANDFSA